VPTNIHHLAARTRHEWRKRRHRQYELKKLKEDIERAAELNPKEHRLLGGLLDQFIREFERYIGSKDEAIKQLRRSLFHESPYNYKLRSEFLQMDWKKIFTNMSAKIKVSADLSYASRSYVWERLVQEVRDRWEAGCPSCGPAWDGDPVSKLLNRFWENFTPSSVPSLDDMDWVRRTISHNTQDEPRPDWHQIIEKVLKTGDWERDAGGEGGGVNPLAAPAAEAEVEEAADKQVDDGDDMIGGAKKKNTQRKKTQRKKTQRKISKRKISKRSSRRMR